MITLCLLCRNSGETEMDNQKIKQYKLILKDSSGLIKVDHLGYIIGGDPSIFRQFQFWLFNDLIKADYVIGWVEFDPNQANKSKETIMAGKKAPLPLQQYEFSKSAIYSVDHDDRTYNYAGLKLNTGSSNASYNFDGDQFKFTATSCTGFIEGNRKFLLASVRPDENGKLFAFNTMGSKDGGGWEVKKEIVDKDAELWNESGCLIGIDSANIPALEMLVDVLSEKKLIVYGNITINLKSDSTKLELAKSTLSDYLDFYIENGRSWGRSNEKELWASIANFANVVGVPLIAKSLEMKPEIIEGVPTGDEIPNSIPFIGEFPIYEKVLFTLPPEQQPKTGGGYNKGGANVTVESYKPTDAISWIEANGDRVVALMQKYTLVELQYIMAIAGVNTLPQLITNKIIQTEEPNQNGKKTEIQLVTSDSNGHLKTEEKITQTEIIEPKETDSNDFTYQEIETEEESEEVKQKLMIEALTKHLKRLEVPEKHIPAIIKKHGDNLQTLIDIYDSRSYWAEQSEIKSKCAELRGIEDGMLFPHQLNSVEDLTIIHSAVKRNDEQLKIDQTASISW